jgi:hypothetical protein
MRDCLERIAEYTGADRARFEFSRLVQDAVIRNLQTLAEASQRLSSDIKVTEPQIPWRELSEPGSGLSFSLVQIVSMDRLAPGLARGDVVHGVRKLRYAECGA